MSTTVKEQKKPFLFVDAGNLLSRQPRLLSAPSPERLTAEGIIAIYTAMQVDGVAVGPLDLAAGLDLLHSSHKQGFPWLSANLLDAQGKPLFSPYRIKEAGALKAGIIGLTGMSAIDPATSLPGGASCAQWQTVLPDIIGKIASQCDILILLSSLNLKENQEIAQQFPELQIIITADPNLGSLAPQLVNRTTITQTDRQGKYQEVLTIDWSSTGKWGNSQEEKLRSLRHQLMALEQHWQQLLDGQNGQETEFVDEMQRIISARAILEQEITKKEQQTEDFSPTTTTLSHKLFPLTPDIPEDPGVKALVTTISNNIAALRQQNNSPPPTTAPPRNQP